MKLQLDIVLNELIKLKRLTLREISKGTGIPSSTIAEWQNGRSPRNPAQVKKVADFLGVSLHYLLFANEDNQEPLQKIIKEEFFTGTYEITVRKIQIKKD